MASVEELAEQFRASANDHWVRSPFYGVLNRGIADEPAIVDLLTAAPEQQQLPVLLLAAVHSIVLAEPDLDLPRWYPTVTDQPLATDPFPAFRQLCLDRTDEIRAIVATRVTQTNEVGRSALFLPALGLVAAEVGPLSLVDVGTSGGLNLQLDRFSYRYDPGGSVGPPSPVTIETGTRGAVPVPTHVPEISSRVGIDRDPIDVSDPDEARWLMACVWPDQSDRFERLRGAIELARQQPAPIIAGDAVDLVDSTTITASEHGHPVVLNSWMLNYLDESRHVEYVESLDRVGSDHDLTWIFAESPGMAPGLPFPDEITGEHTTALVTATWRDGVRTVALNGRAHPHGYWLHWLS